MPQKMYKDLFQPISITSTKEIKKAISPKAHGSMLITVMMTSKNLVILNDDDDTAESSEYSAHKMIPWYHLSTLEPRCNEGPRDWQSMLAITKFSLYPGSFPYILLLLGRGILFAISRSSLYRGSLNRGSRTISG